MWQKSHSIVTKDVTKEQMWKLFSNVNQWHTWDQGIEFAKLEGRFEKGNHFVLKPKRGPKIRIMLVETLENKRFVDCTSFPLAKMYGEHTFEDTPSGLKITTTMRMEGPLAFLWRKLVGQEIADGVPAEMPEQVKAAAKL